MQTHSESFKKAVVAKFNWTKSTASLPLVWSWILILYLTQYVAVNLLIKYSPLLIDSYFFPVSSNVPGIASIMRSKLGLQKYATEYRGGYVSEPSSTACCGGSTTRCLVLLIVSFDHRANKSPALMTMVSGIGVASTKVPLGERTCRPPLESWKSSVIDPLYL